MRKRFGPKIYLDGVEGAPLLVYHPRRGIQLCRAFIVTEYIRTYCSWMLDIRKTNH